MNVKWKRSRGRPMNVLMETIEKAVSVWVGDVNYTEKSRYRETDKDGRHQIVGRKVKKK